MPLACYIREPSREIVFAGNRQLSRAVGALAPGGCPGVDSALPLVPLCALPPHPPAAAGAHSVCCQGQVPYSVPLGEQLRPPCSPAELVKGFPDAITPLHRTESAFCPAACGGTRADWPEQQKTTSGEGGGETDFGAAKAGRQNTDLAARISTRKTAKALAFCGLRW